MDVSRVLKICALTSVLINIIEFNAFAINKNNKEDSYKVMHEILDYYNEQNVIKEEITINRNDKTISDKVKNSFKKEDKELIDLPHDTLGDKIKSVKSKSVSENQLMIEAYDSYKNGYYEISLDLYEKILKKNSKNQDALFGKAVIHQILGHTQEAKSIYLKILKKNPDSKFALNNFLTIIGREDPDSTLNMLKNLESKDYDLAIIPAHIANIYHIKGDFKQAIVYYKKAANLDPNQVEYVYNMAMMFEKLGRSSDAIILYNRVVNAIDSGEFKTSVKLSDVKYRISRLSKNN